MLILAGLAMWFWIFLCPGQLRILEVTQYFPYSLSHLAERMEYPGGFSEYVSEFFVQFFYYAFPAGLIVTLALLCLQALTWSVMNRISPKEDESFFPLSFLPSFCGWAFLCVFGNMFTAIVAVSIVEICWLAYSRIKKWKLLFLLVFTIPLYWLAGPLSLLFLLLSVVKGLADKDLKSSVIAAACVLLWAILPILASFLSQHTLKELFIGIDYCCQVGEYPKIFFVFAFSPLAVAVLSAIFPTKVNGRGLRAIIFWLSAAAIFFGGFYFALRHCDPIRERVLEYDGMCYRRDWNAVLKKAQVSRPASLAEVSAVNLALAKEGRLLDEMFSYPQPGPAGLFPDYANGYLVALPVAEAAYHAGLLNTARHYTFEEYESYPNFAISSRHMRRLAEIDMINGNYKVAERFLKSLSRTLFYGKWAKKYLSAPESLSDDAEYAYLMQFRDSSDYLYNDSSDDDKRTMLRRLVGKTHARTIAADYLIAYDLLGNDLFSFKHDFAMIDYKGEIPEYVQEAIVLLDKVLKDEDFKNSPLVSPESSKKYDEYQMALIENKSGGWIRAHFGNTFYYYFSTRNLRK